MLYIIAVLLSDPDSSRKQAIFAARPSEDVAASQGALHGLPIGETVAPQVAPASVEMPRVIRALRNPDFRLFWIGNFLSNIGTWMQNVAQGWLVFELSKSAFWLGVVGFAASSPMLVFALIGGVIADRVDRRRLMLRTQSAMMIFAFVLAALTWARVINVHEIVLLAFLTGIAMSLNMPSYQALVPQLVPREDLTNAIALNSAQFNMSRVIGPTLGGLAMTWVGVGGNFFLNGLSFLAVLVALWRIHYPPPALDNGAATMWQNLADGFRYVYERREMNSLLLLVALASVFGIPYFMFLPLFAKDILHVGERGLGLLMGFSGLGAFLGAATVAYTGKVRRRGRFVFAAGVSFLIAVILFTFSRRFAVSAALLVAAGYSIILMVANVNSALQHLASEEMRGRVMSMYGTAYLGFAPIGSLIAGSLSGIVPAPRAIAGMCVLALALSAWMYCVRPELRHLD